MNWSRPEPGDKENLTMGADARDRFRAWARTLLSHHHGVYHGTAPASETYQTSTMAALLDGIYDGDVTIAELLTHGDFGLGTFNHLDGEMVVLDGVCHRLRADGSASIAARDDRTPFAAVTWFRPEITIPVSSPAGRRDVVSVIDEAIKTTNLIQAIRIDGTFSQVRTRTVMAQSPPYPPLTKATANEPITDFGHIAGTLAGFRTPDYEQGISVAGYHLHFINEPRTRGGHCLDYEIERGEIRISTSSELHLSLPRNEAFLKADMSPGNAAQQIRQTEGG
jgi:acetolactate decarboxylase